MGHFPGAETLGRHTIGLTTAEAAHCKAIGKGSISAGVRMAAQAGLATMAGNLRPVWAVQDAVRKLEAAASDLQELACPTLSSGAAWGHSPADIDKARRHGVNVMALPLGVIATGENDRQILCLDAESGLLLIADKDHGPVEIPMDLPLLAEIAEALDGALAAARRHGADTTGQALGAELQLPNGDLLQVIACGGSGPAIGLVGGPLVPLPSPLALMTLAAEVRSLVVRSATAALDRRQALEATLRQATAAAAPERVAK